LLLIKMSSSESKHKIPNLTIHLNAGFSHRVVQLVKEQNNPNITLVRNAFGDYGFLTLSNQTQMEIDTFVNKLKNIYPMELDYDFDPRKLGNKSTTVVNKLPNK